MWDALMNGATAAIAAVSPPPANFVVAAWCAAISPRPAGAAIAAPRAPAQPAETSAQAIGGLTEASAFRLRRFSRSRNTGEFILIFRTRIFGDCDMNFNKKLATAALIGLGLFTGTGSTL